MSERQAAPVTDSDPRLRAFSLLARVAEDRGHIYRWLAAGFYPPDSELVHALNSDRLGAEVRAHTAWLGADQARLAAGLKGIQQCAEVSLPALETEYGRLFGKSVERTSPHEATYRWRDASSLLEAGDGIVRALRQQYGQFGLTPRCAQEDHVAVELEFMAYLCRREATHWEASAAEAARQLRRHERAFLDDHLGRWLSEFCGRVHARGPESFYAQLANLTDAWLSLEDGPGYLPAARQT